MVASRSIGLGQLRSAQVGKGLAKRFNVLTSDLLGAMSQVAHKFGRGALSALRLRSTAIAGPTFAASVAFALRARAYRVEAHPAGARRAANEPRKPLAGRCRLVVWCANGL